MLKKPHLQIISAEVHTDCHTAKATFDATPWFIQASDNNILNLAKCGWGGDYPADEVAEFFSYHKRNDEVEEAFHILHILRRSGKEIGVECHINEEDAINWLKNHRPYLVNIIQNAKDNPTNRKSYVATMTLENLLNISTGEEKSLKQTILEMGEKEAHASGFPTEATNTTLHISSNGHCTPKENVKFYVVIEKNT